MRRWNVVASAAVAAALSLSACGGGQSSDSPAPEDLSGPQADLYSAAQDEAPLTWYSSQDPARNDAVVEAFLEAYPDLQVTSLRLASGDLATRYSQERDADVNNAGLITLASPEFVAQGQASDWFETFDASEFPELKNMPEDFFAEGVATTGISPFGIGYNTNLVDEPPTSWEDMLAPEYQGKIILGDPRNVPSYVALARVWLEEYGPEFLEGVAAQDPQVVDSMVPGTQQLAAGEAAIGLPSVVTVLQPVIDQGAPLDYVIPDVTTGNEFQTMIPTANASPNTARLLYQFLLTDEGQLAFNGETSASPLGVEGTAPLPKNYRAPRIEELPKYQDEIFSRLGLTG